MIPTNLSPGLRVYNDFSERILMMTDCVVAVQLDSVVSKCHRLPGLLEAGCSGIPRCSVAR